MLPFHIYDVFTETPFTGNPLAIVEGADAITPAQMQILARQFNLSETIFVQRPRDPAHTARVRIFFPTAEIPFAGHPTLGCAIHLALKDVPEGDFTTNIVLEEEAGLVPVTITRRDGRIHGTFTAPVLPERHAADLPVDLIAQALDLSPAAIGFASHRPGVWQGGPRFLYIPLADRAALAAARAIEPHWSRMLALAGADSAYLYTPGAGADFQARMYSPTAGIPEDPATGSATAILAGALHAAGVLSPGTQSFQLLQGAEMGRPSDLTLSVDSDATGPRAIRISGSAVAISHGETRIPPAPKDGV